MGFGLPVLCDTRNCCKFMGGVDVQQRWARAGDYVMFCALM